MPNRIARIAIRTSLLYAFFAALWIVLSDRVVVTIWSYLQTIGRIATYKGWAFVAVTASLLYGTLRGQLRRWEQEIERRRQAEEALHRYELLAGNTRDIMLFMRRDDARILEANAAATKAYGYSREELLALSIHDLLPSESQGLTADQMAVADREGILFETLHRRKDGSLFPVEVSSQGATIGGMRTMISVVRNITDRKQIEEALRQANRKLTATLESITDGFVSFDREWRYVYVNGTAASLLEKSKEELLGKTPWEVFSQSPHLPFYTEVTRTCGTNEPAHFEESFPDPVNRWYEYHCYPESEGVSVYFRDITQRKHVEETLRKAHDELERRVQERTAELQRQAELLNLTHDAIIACDLNHKILFWNRGAEERYGWSADEVKRKVTDDLLRTVYPGPRQEIEQELLIHGRWEGELTDTTRDGRKIIVASRQALRRDQDGKPIAILEINSDITEQKLMEEQLRQAQKLEAVGTLSGGIAHDFNNILAAIIGFTEMVLDDVSDTARVKQEMERVLKAGLRGRDLVRQILAFSRKAGVERKRVSLTPLVKETHELLRASLPSTIRTALDFTTKEDFVFADPTQLQQVLMNLATNAAYAMRENGGLLAIELSSVTFPEGSLLPDPGMEPGTYVRVTVKDTGTGMTEEVRQRIFEPFFTTKQPGQGTGMGLAVVYGIVKTHGGAITVQSEVGRGSTFDVFLPQAQRPEVKKDETTTSVLPAGTERILFVDDEEMLVEMARGMLESLGYHVTVAANGSEAWSLFLEDPSRFDLVITDQTMPDVTGVTLARKILGVHGDTPIILCTGYSETVSAEKAKDVGISAFVMKPMVKRELAETIRRVLDGRKE